MNRHHQRSSAPVVAAPALDRHAIKGSSEIKVAQAMAEFLSSKEFAVVNAAFPFLGGEPKTIGKNGATTLAAGLQAMMYRRPTASVSE